MLLVAWVMVRRTNGGTTDFEAQHEGPTSRKWQKRRRYERKTIE
jgi:hypothetical protein